MHVLPVVPVVLGPPVPQLPRQAARARGRAGLQRLAHRRVVRRASRAASSRWRCPVLWDPELERGRGAPRREEGLPLAHVHREPGDARPAELPRPALGSAVARARGRGDDPQRPPRFVGQAHRDRTRRADRRDDHVAADQHLPGRGRPRVVARVQGVPGAAGRALRGRHRLDPVLPRPPRPHLRHAPRVDRPGLRRPHAVRRVPRAHPHVLHRRSRSGSSSATTSASTTCAGSRTTRTPTRRGRSAPEEFAAVAARFDVSDADINKITHENAMRWYRFDPFAHRPREQCTVAALRAEVPDHDVADPRDGQRPIRRTRPR